jgi:hypothetical protein
MVKSRRAHRKGSKKGSKKGSRKGVFGYVYAPVDEVLGAVGNVTRATTNTLRGVVVTGVTGVRRVGKNVTRRADKVVSKLVAPITGKKRKGTRKSKKNNKK